MKKSSKTKKIWIVLGIAIAFIITCGVVVYATNGFGDYKDIESITRTDRNDIIDKITTVANSNGMVAK